MNATGDTVIPAILQPRAARARRPNVLPRLSIHSSAWMLSLGIHGLLVVALWFCYFKGFGVKGPDDSIVVAMQFHPSTECEPEPVVEEEVRQDPLPPIVVESIDTLADQQPLPPTELPPVPLEVAPPKVDNSAKPKTEHLVDTTSTAFVVKKVKKLNISEPATAPYAGGSHAGSGAAPALIAVASSSPNAITVANGVSGAGPGSGAGRGSGEGTNLGNGTPKGDGLGYGTGHGDGIGSGSGAGREGGSIDKPPRVDRLERPDYPRDALRSGIEGTVKCLVQVLASGKVGEVSVYQSSGYTDLDRNACEAVKRSRFFPAEANGKAVNFELVVPYVYKIKR